MSVELPVDLRNILILNHHGVATHSQSFDVFTYCGRVMGLFTPFFAAFLGGLQRKIGLHTAKLIQRWRIILCLLLATAAAYFLVFNHPLS